MGEIGARGVIRLVAMCNIFCCCFRFIGKTLRGSDKYGAGVGPIWLDNVKCTGSETNIGSCLHNGWGLLDCLHSEDVSIRCVSVTTVAPPPPIRGKT